MNIEPPYVVEIPKYNKFLVAGRAPVLIRGAGKGKGGSTVDPPFFGPFSGWGSAASGLLLRSVSCCSAGRCPGLAPPPSQKKLRGSR